jgi:hypothetical protein
LNPNLRYVFVALAAYLFAGTSFAADRNKVLHVASTNIETLDPQRWNDDPSYQIQFAIFEGLYEWDYLALPSRLVPNTATAMPTITDDGRTWTIRLKAGIHFTPDPAFKGRAARACRGGLRLFAEARARPRHATRGQSGCDRPHHRSACRRRRGEQTGRPVRL